MSIRPSVTRAVLVQAGQGAANVHLILDNEGHLPHLAVITDGKKSDQAVARTLHFEPGTILVIDRGSVHYQWWQSLTDTGVYLVTRFKKDILPALVAFARYRPSQPPEIRVTRLRPVRRSEVKCKQAHLTLQSTSF